MSITNPKILYRILHVIIYFLFFVVISLVYDIFSSKFITGFSKSIFNWIFFKINFFYHLLLTFLRCIFKLKYNFSIYAQLLWKKYIKLLLYYLFYIIQTVLEIKFKNRSIFLIQRIYRYIKSRCIDTSNIDVQIILPIPILNCIRTSYELFLYIYNIFFLYTFCIHIYLVNTKICSIQYLNIHKVFIIIKKIIFLNTFIFI